MKYFMIALIVTSSLNAMRFDEHKAGETAQVITTTLGIKSTPKPDKKEGAQGQQKEAPTPLKSKL